MAELAAPRKRKDLRAFRILVVDDDPAVHDAVREALRRDFVVTSCLSLAEADGVDTRGFDAAFVDYRLPDGPGLDFVKRLAAASPRIPTVFATGFGTYALAREALAKGAAALLEKPVGAGELVRIVYKLVGERPLPGPADDIARDDRLRAVESFLESRLFAGVREKDLLEDLGWSRSAFHRYFTEQFGMTFRAYVGAERLRMAKYLLAATSLPVSEVASRVGLLNPRNFSAWFKKACGSSPLGYRGEASG